MKLLLLSLFFYLYHRVAHDYLPPYFTSQEPTNSCSNNNLTKMWRHRIDYQTIRLHIIDMQLRWMIDHSTYYGLKV